MSSRDVPPFQHRSSQNKSGQNRSGQNRPIQRLIDRFGSRGLSIALAIALEVLLVLMLLTLGGSIVGVEEGQENLTSIDIQASPPPPEPAPEPEPEPEPEAEPEPEPEEAPPETPPEPAPPQPEIIETPRPEPVLPPPVLKTPNTVPAPAPPPAPPRPAAPAPSQEVYGPVAPPRRSPLPDSPRVGTAPNGEPLYGAEWYRRPREGELDGYLSTADGPGWGMIACKTAPDYRVEDCIALEEWPRGSNINRALLAAAWQFQVRPPRLNGKYLVGEWVRIRIDLNMRQQRSF